MKVFGIGLSRTGTTSLTEALRILGYRALHFPTRMDQVDEYDALTDTPVAMMFKEFDNSYPGSRFIYTIRDMQSWLESMRWFMPTMDRPDIGAVALNACDVLYDTRTYDRDKLVAAYQRHHEAVIKHFKDRSGDLLVLDIVGNAGWEKLCSFLRKPLPNKPFPHENIRR